MVAATSTKIALQFLLVLIWMGLRNGRNSDVFKMQKVYQHATAQIKAWITSDLFETKLRL